MTPIRRSEEVLDRPKVRRKYHLTPSRAAELLAILRQQGEFVERVALPTPLCRDPDDEMFLEVAVAGRADVIVTQDKDLPALAGDVEPAFGIRILTAIEFLRMLDPDE